MKRLLLALLLISGCLAADKDVTAIALDTEDLGRGWALASENLSDDSYTLRFVGVEQESGQVLPASVVNKIRLYPDAARASEEYQRISRTLESSIPTSNPNVGESSVLWGSGGFIHLVFIRGEVVVEIQYASTAVADPNFIIGLAEKADARIK